MKRYVVAGAVGGFIGAVAAFSVVAWWMLLDMEEKHQWS